MAIKALMAVNGNAHECSFVAVQLSLIASERNVHNLLWLLFHQCNEGKTKVECLVKVAERPAMALGDGEVVKNKKT